NFGSDAISEAFNAGQLEFGENRAQELSAKYEVLGSMVKWHFIGTLQSNKAKYAVKAADLIHSIDSLELLIEVDKQAAKLNKVQDILLQYKTSFEDTKAGIRTEDDLFSVAEHCRTCKNISFIGLMTIAPFVDDAAVVRNSFSTLRLLKDKLNKNGFNLSELSMGMSDDFDIAIEEGATMVRVGSAIFGTRDYSKTWKSL
ncbi:MAG: YggS family pyridoxal phosphate-dependent enzyme, partial [Bacteroidota bacterium]|nr:YggS family pyridoxal phosphate-dependent enzyme [Bacteroidota bacterium]